jgi:S-formylglutathione hydrolase FrmB
MHKDIKCVVVKPDSYSDATRRFPTVYLLHGYSGSYASWVLGIPELNEQADQLNILIVCPDGGYGSWYFDSPIDTSYKYETHVSSEVIPFIDSHYRTLAAPEFRAVTGFSMGGHGALYLALRHLDLFGAAGSISGGVDLLPFSKNWEIAKRLGDPATQDTVWKNRSIVHMVERYPAARLALIIDCGTEDFFYTVNANLHQKLLDLKVPHDYTERPGKHNWEYCRNALRYQLLYFKLFFEHGRS